MQAPGAAGQTLREVGFLDIAKVAGTFYVGFFLLVVWPLLTFLLMLRASYRERMHREGVPATVRIVSAEQTDWHIIERPVPVDPKKPNDVLVDFDKPVAAATSNVNFATASVRYLPPQFGAMIKSADAVKSGSSTEVEVLRTLRTMRDEGLISNEEYQAKKAEIIGRMRARPARPASSPLPTPSSPSARP